MVSSGDLRSDFNLASFFARPDFRVFQHNPPRAALRRGLIASPVLPDSVEEVRSCRRLVWLIQSGPGYRSGLDDGGTPHPAGGAVL